MNYCSTGEQSNIILIVFWTTAIHLVRRHEGIYVYSLLVVSWVPMSSLPLITATVVPHQFQVVCSQNAGAGLKGLSM